MAWNLLDVFGFIFDAIELLSSNSSSRFRSTSDRKNLNYDEKPQKQEWKRSQYFTEKVSAMFIAAAALSFFMVFKDPLPAENYRQTLAVACIIGLAIALLLFFILHVMELYYFKNLFKLLLFSSSVIAFCISVVLYIYFKSGWFYVSG
ncbi:branched-chain amino acid ABC transporter substrate-binding protein [Chryseobacterium arthrosphaerae]|uniref:branched-chain amino acid ABC transporter substrate-binding protein n=1 Tax=Chryseobacterium arthrosphaerae TaxID=651561 RepID=UPI00241DC459|nr:branched-chain amino acid ABC transporter substrate-binding protein [Chryseobacterium arthrosphaerae]